MSDKGTKADIVIATVGRFHYGTLASRLHALGRLRRFYSGFSQKRLACPDVPGDLVCSHLYPMTPVSVLAKLGLLRGDLLVRGYRWAQIELDRFIARDLPDCSTYVALSGCAVESGRVAKNRGIGFVCERASEHIVRADRRMAAEYARWGVPYRPTDPVMIERELAEYEQADRIIVMSQRSRESFAEQDPTLLDKVHVVAPDVSANFDGARRQRAGDDVEVRLLFVGAQSLRKGFGRLLRAYARVRTHRSSLSIVGNPVDETPTLLRDVDTTGVRWLGVMPQARLAQHYADADLLVVPSVEDGLPTCALEALACGCPVLISDLAGSAQYVEQEVNGLIYPGEDDDALAGNLHRVLTDADLLGRLKEGVQRLGATWNLGKGYGERWLETLP
ncbi:MAG: glycosyltransferase family 4 protein [Gammaproteobacteria bacterium]